MAATVQSAECRKFAAGITSLTCPAPWKVDFAPTVPLIPHPFVMLLQNPWVIMFIKCHTSRTGGESQQGFMRDRKKESIPAGRDCPDAIAGTQTPCHWPDSQHTYRILIKPVGYPSRDGTGIQAPPCLLALPTPLVLYIARKRIQTGIGRLCLLANSLPSFSHISMSRRGKMSYTWRSFTKPLVAFSHHCRG